MTKNTRKDWREIGGNGKENKLKKKNTKK